MASRLQRRDIAQRYYRRSAGWKASFNRQLGLVLPRTREGGWLHTDPMDSWGYEEANAWQATFGLSHDIKGLAELMGGNDSLCSRLDFAFRQSAKDDFVSGYGNGYVNYSNQPGLSNAHVFAHAGRPDLTQYWVRRVRRQTYGGVTPDKGYGGNDEDQGQMSSLSALMSIGLFAIDGGSGCNSYYDVTAPIFDKITIKLHPDYCSGREFRIVTHNNGADNCYIRRISLNGVGRQRPAITHAEFVSGGQLDIWLDSKP